MFYKILSFVSCIIAAQRIEQGDVLFFLVFAAMAAVCMVRFGAARPE